MHFVLKLSNSLALDYDKTEVECQTDYDKTEVECQTQLINFL